MLFFCVVTVFSGKWLWYAVAKLRAVVPYSLIGNTIYVYILSLYIHTVLNFLTIFIAWFERCHNGLS